MKFPTTEDKLVSKSLNVLRNTTFFTFVLGLLTATAFFMVSGNSLARSSILLLSALLLGCIYYIGACVITD